MWETPGNCPLPLGPTTAAAFRSLDGRGQELGLPHRAQMACALQLTCLLLRALSLPTFCFPDSPWTVSGHSGDGVHSFHPSLGITSSCDERKQGVLKPGVPKRRQGSSSTGGHRDRRKDKGAPSSPGHHGTVRFMRNVSRKSLDTQRDGR